jgi:hypothetical protein
MTTGRINQVTTFLNAKERDDTPKQKVNTNTIKCVLDPEFINWIESISIVHQKAVCMNA